MADEAKRFLETVRQDATLRAELQALKSLEDPEEALRRTLALAAGAGMHFTRAELDAELARRAPELSEEQLDEVAGGSLQLQQNLQNESRWQAFGAFLDGLSNT